MSDAANTAAADGKKYLKWYNKVGYGPGGVAGNVAYVLLSAPVMIYLADTAGLSAGVVGTLVTVFWLFDGPSDVTFGTLLDHIKTWMGKVRPWMSWGFAGCAGMIVAAFTIPIKLGETAKYAWFFIAYAPLNTMSYIADNIVYSSLIALTIRNGSKRVQMGFIRFMFTFGMNLLIRSITIGGMATFRGGIAGRRTAAIIYALLGLAVGTLSVLSVRELLPEEPAGGDDTKQKDDTLTVSELAEMLLSNKYYLFILVAPLLTQISTTILSMGIYLMKHILGDENPLGTLAWAINTPPIVGLLVAPIIVKKLEEVHRVNLGGYAIVTLGRPEVLVATYSHNIPLMLVLSAMVSLGMNPLQGALNAMIVEVSEYVWLHTDKRIDGLMFSCTSPRVKIGGGIGTAMARWLLAASGCNGGLGMQPDPAIRTPHTVCVWSLLITNAPIFLLLTCPDAERVSTRLREQIDA